MKKFDKKGLLHCENGPAYSTKETKEWYLHGKKHREDGPAVEYTNGDQEYWVNGKRHREGSPAIVRHNTRKYLFILEYYLNGQMHYIEGPAIINKRRDGTILEKWYVKGVKLNTPASYTEATMLINILQRKAHADKYL